SRTRVRRVWRRTRVRTTDPDPARLGPFDGCYWPRPLPDVPGGRPDQLGLALLLEDVGRPACHARAGEHRREQLRWHFGEVEDHRGPELDIGCEHPVWSAGVELGQSGLLESLCGLEARSAELSAGLTKNAGPRPFGAVDA